MTEDDDAFIRAVVDNPGVDLPRLVYADWLDDRSDPRGPFLRAEVEWAQPWKEGKRPGDATGLRVMAANLDTLWVARICRPPLGVCCDQLELFGFGPRLAIADVREAERRLDVRFPDEYVAFVLNYNGFFTTGRGPYPPSHQQVPCRSYSLHDGWTFGSLGNVHRFQLREDDLFPDAIPFVDFLPTLVEPVENWLARFVYIGHDPDCIGGFFLGIAQANLGEIRVLDTSVEIESGVRFNQHETPHSVNLPTLLANLPAIPPRPDALRLDDPEIDIPF